MELYLNKDYIVKCPKCGAFLMRTDKRKKVYEKIACRSCRKWIWCIPANESYEIKHLPERTTSSGMNYL